jgi:sulfoxide reductase heme-binding subunit YedZ
MAFNPTTKQVSRLKAVAFVLSLLPFFSMAYLTLTNQLVEPLQYITRATGDWTLYFLCITLAVTPLRRLTRWNWLIKLRRMVGLYAFFYGLLLIPLAVTSTNAMVRRLGGKRWQWLHRLVYVIAPLGILHFWWMKAGKHDFSQPILFGLIVLALLGVRAYWATRVKAAVPVRA